jgi:hypothetical protein
MNNSSLDSNKELQKYSQQLGFDPLSPTEQIETTDTPDPDIFDEDLQGSSDTQSRAKNPLLQYGAAALIGTVFVGLPLSAILGIGGGKQAAKTTEPKEKAGQPATPSADPEVDRLKTNIALDIQSKQDTPPTAGSDQAAPATQNPSPERTATATPTARSVTPAVTQAPSAKPVASAIAQAPAAKPVTPMVTPVPTVKPITPTVAQAPSIAQAPSTITQPIPARTTPRSPDRRVENPPKSIQRYPSPQPAHIAALPTNPKVQSQSYKSQAQRLPFGIQSRPIQRQIASLPTRIASLPQTVTKLQPQLQPDRSQAQRLPFGVQSRLNQRQASLPSKIVSRLTTPRVQLRSLPTRIAALPTSVPKVPTQRQPVRIATLPIPPKSLARSKPFQQANPNGSVPIAANLRPQSATILPTIAPLVHTTPAAPPMSYQEASALSIYGGDGDTPTPIVGSTKLKNNDLASASLAQNLSPALSLPVGVVVSGRTITPYNSISKGNNTQQGSDVSVILDQPIQLAQGYSLPVGTIVQFGVTVADNGLVQAASKGVYINNSPIQVPAGAFALTAENSQALVAQQRAMRQDELASADTRTAIYGALGTVGQVLTQAGNQTVIGTTGLGTVSGIQTNNPTPNILAAAAQGAFQPLLTANQTRTAATSAQILSLSKINTLPVQTKVKVFVAAPGVIQIPLAGDRTTTQSSPQYRTAMEATDRVTQPIDPQIQPIPATQPDAPTRQLPITSSTNPPIQLPQPTYLPVPQVQTVQPYSPIPQIQPVQTISPIQPTQPANPPAPQIDPQLKDPDYS